MMLNRLRYIISPVWSLRQPILGLHILISTFSVIVLFPLFGMILQLLFSLSHTSSLTDMGILTFILSPYGVFTATVLATFFFTLQVVKFVTMLRLFQDGGSVLSAIRHTISTLPRLLLFSALLFMRLALLFIPLAVGLYLVKSYPAAPTLFYAKAIQTDFD